MKNQYLKKEIGWLLKEKYKGKLGKEDKSSSSPFAAARVTEEAKKDIEKLKRGMPVDYLIGFTKFLGCKIDLSQRPFIPRPETEYWAGKAIKEIQNEKSKMQNLEVLDIFSGSGCIGIAVLKACPELCRRVDFAEVEKKFLKQIKINLKLNRINPRKYRLIRSNIFQNIKGKYHYIFANPPYIGQKRISYVQKSVLNFEPKTAFLGDKEGLGYIRKFLEKTKSHLKEKGKIYMEFDSSQKDEIGKILKKYNYSKYIFFKDQYDKYRYLTAEF